MNITSTISLFVRAQLTHELVMVRDKLWIVEIVPDDRCPTTISPTPTSDVT